MEADGEIGRIAARQRGVFTTAQARGVGLSSDMLTTRVRRGQIDRIEPGVYRIAGAPPTWEQAVLIACLAERGWASHRTAAALWELEGCRRGVVEVVTRRWSRRPNRSVRVHETRRLEEVDLTELDGIPVTSCERTVVDLGAVVPAERVTVAYHDALNRRLVTPESTWRCLEPLDVRGRPWVPHVRRLVARTLGVDEVLPNVFERRLAEVLTRAGLPEPTAQVEIRRPDGTFVARVDAAYLDVNLLMECDSERWHGSWVRRKEDLRRDRELLALGYRVLRFSWEDLTSRPAEVVRHVVAARSALSA
jgi:very-short-patch-repair endonuclease